MRKNQDVDWNDFNADTYRNYYFNPVGTEDRWIIQEVLRFLKATLSDEAPVRRAVDVGSGPSIIPGLIVAPYVESIDLVEPGLKNVSYLRSVLSNPARLQSDWSDALGIIAHDPSAVPAHSRAATLLSERVTVRKAGVNDLEDNTYDLLTTIFCAESATNSREECAEMMQKILASLKKGSLYIGSFMEHSKGYPDQSFDTLSGEVEARKFPSADIDEAWLQEQFKGTDITIKRCPIPPGMRQGYTGVLLAMGTK